MGVKGKSKLHTPFLPLYGRKGFLLFGCNRKKCMAAIRHAALGAIQMNDHS
jgi:hypothetical protein